MENFQGIKSAHSSLPSLLYIHNINQDCGRAASLLPIQCAVNLKITKEFVFTKLCILI